MKSLPVILMVAIMLTAPQNSYADSLLSGINDLLRLINVPAEADVIHDADIINKPRAAKIRNIIREAASRYSVHPLLIESIIKVESNFNPRAVSTKGAMGLMQLMPGTAREIGVTRPFDPYQNVMGGTYYYKLMLERFGDHKKALYAFNCGPARVQNKNVPRESLDYANSVIRTYSELKKKGDINE